MSHVTEHHAEQEREADKCEQSRIHFSVARRSVCVHDHLELCRNFIHADQSWWREPVLLHLVDLSQHVVALAAVRFLQ